MKIWIYGVSLRVITFGPSAFSISGSLVWEIAEEPLHCFKFN